MHRHPRMLPQRRLVIRHRQSLFIQSMSRLVNRTEQRIEGFVFLKSRGHPYVGTGALAKWMR